MQFEGVGFLCEEFGMLSLICIILNCMRTSKYISVMLRRGLTDLLLMTVVLLGFASCDDRYPHEPDGGVAVAFDGSQCPGAAISQTSLFVYDAGGNLSAVYDYADAYAVASSLLPLEDGHYTIAAVINADEEPAGAATLTALREWVALQSGVDEDLLSGIAEVTVSGNRVIRVVLPLLRGSFSLSVLSVNFALPDASMLAFTPEPTKSRAGYALRCVAELCKSDTGELVLHKAITPELQADGACKVDLQLSEGGYDLRLWVDYADPDAPLDDLFYHTESLKAVTILTDPYVANTDAKDAACGNSNGIMVSGEGTVVTMALQRPLAKFEFITTDLEAFIDNELKAALSRGADAPSGSLDLAKYKVMFHYVGFMPVTFNMSTDKPSDSVTGVSFSGRILRIDNGEVSLGFDYVFVNGVESAVSVQVGIYNEDGTMLSMTKPITVPLLRSKHTLLKGAFMTADASGGVSIDPSYDGDYNIIL